MKLLLAIFTIKLLPSFTKQQRIVSQHKTSLFKMAASHALLNLINSSKQFHFYLLAELIRVILSFFYSVWEYFSCRQFAVFKSNVITAKKTFVFQVVSRRLKWKKSWTFVSNTTNTINWMTQNVSTKICVESLSWKYSKSFSLRHAKNEIWWNKIFLMKK